MGPGRGPPRWASSTESRSHARLARADDFRFPSPKPAFSPRALDMAPSIGLGVRGGTGHAERLRWDGSDSGGASCPPIPGLPVRAARAAPGIYASGEHVSIATNDRWLGWPEPPYSSRSAAGAHAYDTPQRTAPSARVVENPIGSAMGL